VGELIKSIDFIDEKEGLSKSESVQEVIAKTNNGRKLYIESYGCQMNFADSEIVSSILNENGFEATDDFKSADVILVNTCSIRDKAEQTVRNRLKQFNSVKKTRPEVVVGVLGCMAERLKEKLLEEEKIVDLIAGPDAYRDLPKLVEQVDSGQKAINTFLSREETYADISPVRLNSNGVTAFISIMRGCDNMCSFCVVPFTRGRERSRDPQSIIAEAEDLFSKGYREITLLGQNVDSYKWSPDESLKGKAQIERAEKVEIVSFSQLLDMVAGVNLELRVRFSSSHPKDITNEVLQVMKKHDNICKSVHLPVQSGSTRVLELMNRTYTREWYINRVDAIREILGDECSISSDMITGFCSETEEDHQETLSIMDYVKYDFAYMFFYSERPGTLAAKQYTDDVPLATKKRRLSEVIAKQHEVALKRNQLDLGKTYQVLIEGYSKKSVDDLQGRNSANKVVVFPAWNHLPGEYINVRITKCTSATLSGEVVN
jgi:tRNA-2-methylthio-N6-dimethylallyladenosine synthase